MWRLCANTLPFHIKDWLEHPRILLSKGNSQNEPPRRQRDDCIRNYRDSLTLYIKHFRAWMQSLPRVHHLSSRGGGTYEEGVIFEGGRFWGTLAVHGHSSLEGGHLVPSARGWGHVLHVKRTAKQQDPMKACLWKSPVVTGPQAKKAPRYTNGNASQWELGLSFAVQSLSHVWLCDPLDCSRWGSSVQARILE